MEKADKYRCEWVNVSSDYSSSGQSWRKGSKVVGCCCVLHVCNMYVPQNAEK